VIGNWSYSIESLIGWQEDPQVDDGHDAGKRHHCCPLSLMVLSLLVVGLAAYVDGEFDKNSICAKDLKLNSSEVYQSMMIMVMMGITMGDHFMLYARGYRVESTGVQSSVMKGSRVFPKLLNYNTLGGQREVLQVWSSGECSICGCKGCHVGLINVTFFYVDHHSKMYQKKTLNHFIVLSLGLIEPMRPKTHTLTGKLYPMRKQ